MLTNGNTKLGEKVWNFNLPRDTCLNCRNIKCEKYCYAKVGNFLKPWVRASMERNYNQSKRKDFVFKIMRQIEDEDIKFIRLHSSGDFYDKYYYNKWIKIARHQNTVKIVAYTKNIKIDLSKAPDNFIIYFSKEFQYENPGETMKENITAERFAYTVNWNRVPKHMERHPIDGIFCNSKCYKCKFCFISKIGNIVFVINLMWRRLEPREIQGETLFDRRKICQD